MKETMHTNPKNSSAPRIFLTTKKKIAAMLNLDPQTFYYIRIGVYEPGEILAEGLEKVTGISKSEWTAFGRRWDIDEKLKALLAKEKEEEMNFIIGKGFSRKGIPHIIKPIQPIQPIHGEPRSTYEIRFSL